MIKFILTVLSVMIIASAFAPAISPYNPEDISLDDLRQSPGMKHPFGTDSKGRDMLSRVLHGGRISISVAVIAALISMSIGLLVGLLIAIIQAITYSRTSVGFSLLN